MSKLLLKAPVSEKRVIMALQDMRQEYTPEPLREQDFSTNPIEQFAAWFETAQHPAIVEPNAMTLATVSDTGVPSARVVLLKEFDERGFVFYTNYQSDKGAEMKDNPIACVNFFWEPLARQVRITGTVTKVDRAETEAYFAVRPRKSQIGAWASNQSAVFEGGRAEMEKRFTEIEARFADQPIPTPPYWGGYRLRHEAIEFWQGAMSRMHDRLRYRRDGEGNWVIERLAP